MGWLDLIFGKGTSKKVAVAKKIVSAVSDQPKKAASAERRPKLSWSKTAKGNDTTIYDGTRITLFKQDDLWNYCVVEILDEEDLSEGMEEEPIFGDLYPTKAEAKRAALEEAGYY